MATTAQLRASYPEFIRNPSIPTCNFSSAVSVRFPAAGSSYPAGYIDLRVHPTTRQIWRAVAAVMLHYGYPFREPAGGTLACRKITGGSGTTLHAHGIADDHNPSKNAYRVTAMGGLIQWGKQTDMPAAMVLDIERIKLANGLHPMRWGGRWWTVKDPMHYELGTLQNQLAAVNLASLPAGAWSRYLTFEQGGSTDMASAAQKTLVALAFNLFPNEVIGDPNVWNNLPEDDPQWAQDFDTAVSRGAQTLYRKTKNLPLEFVPGSGGGLSPEDLAGAIAQHEGKRASDKMHPHVHDEGQSGPAR